MLNSTHSSKNLRRSSTKQDEPNPMTLPLEKVVEQIDSKVLAYYLEQVSMFLKNSKKDLLFPKLSPYLDAFLVRFISNVQSMEDLLDTFDWNSRSFAEDIIDSLIENENVYKLTYSYENSRIESDILVYKKVYFEKEKNPKQCLTKNSDAPYSSQNDSTKSPNTQGSPRKDLSWVNATLKFIKDNTKTLLQYPTMSYSDAEEVYSVVKQQCKDVMHLGPLCEDLLDAIKVLNETMELKTSFLYVNSIEVQLSIEKCPIKRKGVESKLQPPVKNNNKVQEKTNNPTTSGPQQQESGWNAVVVKKKPKQLPNLPGQSSKQLPNPPGQSSNLLPNPPGQSRKAKRVKTRMEARKAWRQATDESRPREAAEGAAKSHDAPNSDALTPHVDNSPAEKAAPKGTPSVASEPAANAPERRKPARRGKPRGKKKATPAKPVKRNHPDDPFTPRGEGKRSKPNPTTTIAYADALKSDLSVAITVEPYHDLTRKQAEDIKRQVDGLLDEEIFAPRSSSDPYVLPAFKANAFYSEGVLKFWCKDDLSLQWLHRTAAKINSPRPGTELVVKRQREIPKRVKTTILVPQYGPDDTLDRVRKRLACQNTHLDVSNWAVYHSEEQKDKQCLYLVLGVPEEDVEKLKASERRIYYKLGNIYARFLENTSAPPPNPNAPGEVTSDLGSDTLHHTAHSNPPQTTDDADPPKVDPSEVPQEEGINK